MISSSTIRRQFIDFFVGQCGHTYVPSSPVVPHGDETLLFANAGMNQFKDVFLGIGDRPYSRAVNTQKCIRAGGKHNDLDDVGKDTYHHTFFEMLGNWSFGDYFKEEAVRWAWQLLTEVWGLEKSRLHATVFAGDPEHGLDCDDEAAQIWRSVTDIAHDNIHFCGAKDNFWEMGATGPCGPCSEIHIDRTPDLSGGKLVNAGDARVIEIWNLVFIQFNRDTTGALSPLPAKHVDTGMGFERIAAVLQHKDSNYDTDIFTPLFDAIAGVTGAAPYTGSLEKPEDIAYRVIADHARTLTFALADGAQIGAEKREYVLRRILRRAVRYGRQTLGTKDPFFYRLVPVVVEQFGDFFPELKTAPDQVADAVRDEEEAFSRTLDRGIEHFERVAQKSTKQISGRDAFDLYQTYGFPVDLTQLMAEERNLTVNEEGFEKAKRQHQEISRSQGSADSRTSLIEIVQQGDLPPTEFIGYDALSAESTICGVYREVDDRFEETSGLEAGDGAALVVQRTPFYAEAGGQVGDRGVITFSGNARFRVDDTIKIGGVSFHLGEMESGTLASASADAHLCVDTSRRQKIMAHHTVTHVMNHKLRTVLGDGVQQKGSLVDDEKTRFDFSHDRPLTIDQVAEIEAQVATDIERDLAVYADVAPQEDALRIHGLRAVFGEKYPPSVRVVSIGVPVNELLADPAETNWYDYSVEFCGGTHLPSTGPIKAFAITAEEPVGRGVRRVIAAAGSQALQLQTVGARLRERAKELSDSKDVAAAIAELTAALEEQNCPLVVRSEIREIIGDLQKRQREQEKQQVQSSTQNAVEQARQICQKETGPIIVEEVSDADNQTLRSAMDVIRSSKPESALLLGSASDGKAAFVARVPDALIKKGLKAGDWVREAAKVAGGGGGGRPDMAQAGGKDPAKLQDALKAARAFAENKLA